MGNITDTIRTAYHLHSGKENQVMKVARYAIEETEHGRPVWIGKIAEHFALQGHPDLGQKSTASARLNQIKEQGIVYNGQRYELRMVRKDKPKGGRVPVEMWALVLEQPKPIEQLKLF